MNSKSQNSHQRIGDISYWDGPDADPRKHRLDLYLPASGNNWPVLIFAHGGGWNTGDKNLLVAGGHELYGEIGRFYASQGIGTAIINYRLLPHVSRREQIRDVARATAWVYKHIQEYGGNPKSLFVSGHSAGAQLVARVALDPEPLKELGLSRSIIRGVIAVSGAGYEISEKTLASHGGRMHYFERRFAEGDTTGNWQKEVSLLRFVDKKAPPFLIIYASAEPKALQEQSQELARALKQKGISHQVVVIPGHDHVGIVDTLSRDSETTQAVLKFMTLE